MDRKFASLLLICLVTLAVIYGCMGVVLSAQVDRSSEHEPSGNTVPATKTQLSLGRSNSKLGQRTLGDPIDDPKPHR